MFSILAVAIYVPTHSVGCFPFSIPSPASIVFILFYFFDDGHYDRFETVFHFGFDSHFSNN